MSIIIKTTTNFITFLIFSFLFLNSSSFGESFMFIAFLGHTSSHSLPPLHKDMSLTVIFPLPSLRTLCLHIFTHFPQFIHLYNITISIIVINFH